MVAGKEAYASAVAFLPQRKTLKSLRDAAHGCRGCPLYQNATQAVFGEGARTARVVLVGEQPGNDEDLAGRPFVGPAGRVLDQALEQAGIERKDAYVTNAVKHFSWVAKGKRRMHKKPTTREVAACLPWLEHELELIEPHVLVCLGATAAQALFGPSFKVTEMRGKLVRSLLAPKALATVHPSSILRSRGDEERREAMEQFTADLKVVARLLKSA
jgi:uracil-DNA glycosylase family protein